MVSDVRTSSSRRNSTLLGHYNSRSRHLKRRGLLRRATRRFLILVRLERHDKHVLPARRLPTHLPPPHNPCSQKRFKSRSRHYTRTIWLLHARLQHRRLAIAQRRSRRPFHPTTRPKQPRFRSEQGSERYSYGGRCSCRGGPIVQLKHDVKDCEQ